MDNLIQISSIDLATVSAIVAALVTVIGNAFKIDKKYRALLALLLSFGFVLLPSTWLNQVLTALVIGLTASGVYSQVKPRDNKISGKKQDTTNQIKEKNHQQKVPTNNEQKKVPSYYD